MQVEQAKVGKVFVVLLLRYLHAFLSDDSKPGSHARLPLKHCGMVAGMACPEPTDRATEISSCLS